MVSEPLICPRCGGGAFYERDGGPDSWDDDITWTSDVCAGCELERHGWTDEWIDEFGDPWEKR